MSKKPTYEELEKRIKELETVEKSLQESERRLRISTESGGIGLWELDLINLTAWRSLTHDQIFGYKKLLPEWSYETFLDHVVKEDRPLVEEKFGNALKNIDFWDFQCKIKRIDGVIRQIHAKGKPELDKNQNAIKMYGTVQDITDLKLVQREAMVLKTAIDQAPVGIALADENIQIYYCNPEGLGIRGGNIGDLVEIPKDVFDNWQVYQTNGEAYEIDNLPLVRAIKKGETIREEFIVKNQDGTDHNCDAFACPVFENGKIIGGMVVFLDINERKQAENALKEGEAFLGTLIEAIPVPVFYKNRAGQYLGFNKAFESFFGKTKEHLIGKSVFDINPKDLAEIYHAKDKELFEKYGKQQYESQVKNANGELRNVIFNKSVYTDNQGSVVGLIGAILDISERKQAEEQLQKSEERFRNLYDDAPVGYFEYDLRGKITRVNRTELKMLGYTAEEMIGQPCWDFIVDEVAREQILAKLSGVRPPAVGLERTYRRKNGTTFPVLFEDRLLFDEEGNITGIRTAIQDITERKQSEEELLESKEKYRSMMEAMKDSVYICSPDLRVEYMNPTMIRELGHDATGESCSKAIYGFDKKCPWCVHEKVQKGESVVTELFNPKDGHTYDVSHSPIFHVDDSISKMTIYRDITKRKHLEEEREKLISDLQDALAELKTLSGLLPICSHCKKIRDDKGYWNQIEGYIQEHSNAKFSHSICQECAKKHYPDFDIYDD